MSFTKASKEESDEMFLQIVESEVAKLHDNITNKERKIEQLSLLVDFLLEKNKKLKEKVEDQQCRLDLFGSKESFGNLPIGGTQND